MKQVLQLILITLDTSFLMVSIATRVWEKRSQFFSPFNTDISHFAGLNSISHSLVQEGFVASLTVRVWTHGLENYNEKANTTLNREGKWSLVYIKKMQGARTDPWAPPDWTYQHISILLGRQYFTDGIEISQFKTGNIALIFGELSIWISKQIFAAYPYRSLPHWWIIFSWKKNGVYLVCLTKKANTLQMVDKLERKW